MLGASKGQPRMVLLHAPQAKFGTQAELVIERQNKLYGIQIQTLDQRSKTRLAFSGEPISGSPLAVMMGTMPLTRRRRRA
jgi:hypothetical protein